MARGIVTVISAIVTFTLALTGWWVLRGRGVVDGGEPPEQPVNVVIVTWDSVRADHLEPWGADRSTTPWLSEAVGQGVVFERAYTADVESLPSHGALLTGLPTRTTGLGKDWPWLDGRHVTLAEHFQAQGYATVALVTSPWLGEDTNTLQGFDEHVVSHAPEHREAAAAASEGRLVPGDTSHELAPAWRARNRDRPGPDWRDRFKDVSPWLIEALGQWLDRPERDGPFLAYVNLGEARLPRIPSAESRQAVIDDPAVITRGLSTDQSRRRRARAERRARTYSSVELEAIRAVYDATLRDLDAATSALFESLRQRELLDSTLVVLTSERGAPLGDHGEFLPPSDPWESIAHVPLVVWHPGQTPERRDAPVSTRDLFGTTCRLAGVAVPDGLGDWWEPRPEVVIESTEQTALVAGPNKLMAGPASASTYDVVADPDEAAPLDDPELEDDLQSRLVAWKNLHPAYDPAGRGPEDQPEVVEPKQADFRRYLGSIYP